MSETVSFITHGLLSDGMVLQQGQAVKLFGKTTPDASLTVKADWNKHPNSVSANAEGHWKTTIQAPPVGGPYSLRISSDIQEIVIRDILCGEVWLASGQSNMEMPLDGQLWNNPISDAANHLADADYPQIRMFMIDKKAKQSPSDEISGRWHICSPETAREFSAVGYFFAQKIFESLKVPVGIINASMSATAIESWSSEESLQRLGVAYEYGGPDDLEPAFPSGLYNGMIFPLRKYPIAGVIWYQGESNIAWADQYRIQFPDLISQWRSLWNSDKLPFYFVQLAPYNYETPAETVELRDSQLQTFMNVPHTGMVVTLDLGDKDDIHPKYKAPVGQRLALWALAKLYNIKNVVYSGPIFMSTQREGSVVRIKFEAESLGSGLELRNASKRAFELQDKRGTWHPAVAQISADSLLITCQSVSKPTGVRYAWENAPEASLFNREGLPGSPFKVSIL